MSKFPLTMSDVLRDLVASVARSRSGFRRPGAAEAVAAALLAAAPVSAQDTQGEDEATEDLVGMSRDPGQWIMPAKNYASTRYSELDQITTENVDQLELAWTFSVGVDRGQEAAPIVVDNTMYVVTPHPSNLFALDATDGTLKWMYSPPPTKLAAIGVACCDEVNRGAAYSDGKIFYNTLDNHTVAVDAETGKEVSHTELGEISRGETMTMAPLVVKDKVLVGNSGGELGCAAGSPRSTLTPTRLPGAPIIPDPTRTC